MGEIPLAVLSEHFESLMEGRLVKTAVFLTFRFDPAFFEQEILPVLLDVPLSHEPAVRLIQLEDAIRERVDHLAVYYDRGALMAEGGGPKLDIRRVPVAWPTGYFHPKNVLLLVESAEADEDGHREQRLFVAAMSANLTRAGWWENVEVCHVEELRVDQKSRLRADVLKLIGLVKDAAPVDSDHSALEAIRRFVLRVPERVYDTSGGMLQPRLYVGLASDDDSRAREAVPEFLRGLLPREPLCLEVISPYFDDKGDAGPLKDLQEVFSPKETRVYLPRQADGKALCKPSLFDAVRRLPSTQWGKLPADLLKSGPAESAAPRMAHAKVYRFFSPTRRYEALFVGSVNLTNAAFSKGGNCETAFLIETSPDRRPDWWLSIESGKPAEFLSVSEADDIREGPGQALALRYFWESGRAAAYWDNSTRSPALSLSSSGSPLFDLDSLRPRAWVDLAPSQASVLGERLRSTALVTVSIQGEDPATILVQEEGMAHKPSILLNLSVADILRCWAALTPEQKAVIIEDRYQALAQVASALLPSARLGVLETRSLFDGFAGVFHAFASLERGVCAALEKGRTKEAVYLLFGKKYDSLGRLLDQVLDKDKDLDRVNRYTILLCARQLVSRVREVAPAEFASVHRGSFQALEERLGEISRLRGEFTFGTPDERAGFFEWFDRWFLKRAQPTEAES